MVLSRGDGPGSGDLGTPPGSLAELGQSLRAGRQRSALSLAEAEAGTGIMRIELEALESGDAGLLLNRVETLRNLRAYADFLGLPGDAYVLTAIDHWPVPVSGEKRGTAPNNSHLVSLSTAPEDLSPRGLPDEPSSVARSESTITGVVRAIHPVSLHATGQVPVVAAPPESASYAAAPAVLKVTVALLALLVVIGGVALALHSRHASRTGAQGASSSSGASAVAHHRAKVAPSPAAITLTHPSVSTVVFDVRAHNFTVKVVAFNYPCWVEATVVGQATPEFAQVLQGGQSHVFSVTSALRIETASSSARAYVYDGTKFIGYYFPSRAPYFMTFNAGR
jgi:helix-turn-helix protein